MFDFFKKKIKVVTHNDRFHADDVFSVAVLQILYGKNNIKLFRTRDDKKIIAEGDIVLDIGGIYDPDKNLFDHHQRGGAGKRENGVEYASFGLIWKKYGEQICGSKELADRFDKKIVQHVDAIDNGIDIYKTIIKDVHPLIADKIVFSFHPSWKEREKLTYDKQFIKAVDLIRPFLERELERDKDDLEAEKIVEEIYKNSSDKELLVFDLENYFGDEITRNTLAKFPEPLIVVSRIHDTKMWKAKVVPVEPDIVSNRIYYPESWRGLKDEDLEKASGITGLTFCHRSGFLLAGKTKESVIEASKITIAQEPRNLK